jgi:gamma-carbonic anhydrase
MMKRLGAIRQRNQSRVVPRSSGLARAPGICESAFVAPRAYIIGKVVIRAKANIWYGWLIRGGDHMISVGERANLQTEVIVHVTCQTPPIEIRNDVAVEHGAKLHRCRTTSRSLVNICPIILDGTEVRTGMMAADGAVFTPRTEAPFGELWDGNPGSKSEPVYDARGGTRADAHCDWRSADRVRFAQRTRSPSLHRRYRPCLRPNALSALVEPNCGRLR